jgi:acetyl esterase/lipase
MKKLFPFYLLLLLFLIPSCNNSNSDQPKKESSQKESFTKTSDLVWASPKDFDLTMDIYTPKTGRESYPVIIIFHGGAWLINTKKIMNQSATYLASHGEYVVCNVNYRLLGDLNNTVTLNEIVEDVFGAIVWIKENISAYKGDPDKVIVTGDSAGGHLAMMVILQGDNLESDGFSGNTLGFNPSYLPEGKTPEQLASENKLSIQAGMISYGVFDVYGRASNGFESSKNPFWTWAKTEPRGLFGEKVNISTHPHFYKQVSPSYIIPKSQEKKLPPLLFTVGSEDNGTTPESIEEFIAKLKEAGHTDIEYWIHQGRPHAFLDSGSNEHLGITFEKDAPPALDKMLDFLNRIFYK